MRVELLFPSRYFKAADFSESGPMTYTIEAVVIEELRTKGGKEKRPVLYVRENTEKALVLNKTNAMAIAAQHGTETDGWKGKTITLHLSQDRMGGEVVDCVRVMAQSKKGAK